MNLSYLNEMAPEWAKNAFVATGAWAWTVWGPTVPVGAACTAMVLADVWSARRLAARLRDKIPTAREKLKFTSSRFGRVIRTLARVYTLLAIAAIVEHEVMGEWIHLTKFAAALVCFWQAVSILENESSSNPNPWARILSRWLVDKTSRYINKDELPL